MHLIDTLQITDVNEHIGVESKYTNYLHSLMHTHNLITLAYVNVCANVTLPTCKCKYVQLLFYK